MSDNRKEELLIALTQLEDKQQEQKERRAASLEEQRAAYTAERAIREALEAIKKQHYEAETRKAETDQAVRSSANAIQFNQMEIDKLKRELARIRDSERINAEYLAQLAKFEDSCLEAPWRAENRTDGLGAHPYQVEGAMKLAVAKQAILGDKMGLGKSLTSLILADFLGAKKVIIICPSDIMGNFMREIHMWTPHRSPIVLGGMSKNERNFLLPQLKLFPQYMLIVNYEAWRKDPSLISRLKELNAEMLILDEAHTIKEMSTVSCKGVMDLYFSGNHCPNCDDPMVQNDKNYHYAVCNSCGHDDLASAFTTIKYVIPMTGTPVLNKPQEIFPLLKLVAPEHFHSLSNFLRDFCILKSNNKWGWSVNAEAELMKRLGARYLSRNRDQVGIKLPDVLHVPHIVSLEDFKADYPKQYEAYRQVRDMAQLILDPAEEVVMNMSIKLEMFLRLRQVMAWPAGIELKEVDPNGVMRKIAALHVYESVKVDRAVEIIETAVDSGDRVVVFSQFNTVLYEIQKALMRKNSNRYSDIRTAMYVGGMSQYQKEVIQTDFDAKTAPKNPRYDVLLANYKVGGQGLNFTGANHIVRVDREWNPGKEDQAEGRTNRMGQVKNGFVHDIFVEGTIDVWMDELIREKGEMIAGLEEQGNIMQAMFEAFRDGKM